MSEPSREVYKQWATLAFQQYGLYGEPDDPKPDGYESETIFMNLRSVAIVLSILRDEGKTIVADALRDIYIKPFPENGRMRRVIDSRVIKFSETHFVSTSSVYRYLRDARRLFVSVRLLAKESQN